MNAEEIRIKVAECLGWKLVHFDGKGRWLRNGVRTILYPPDFPNSLDACADFERTLAREERKKYIIQLIMVVGPTAKRDSPTDWENGWYEITATAAQRSEAFLRVKGLWTPPAPQEAENNL